MCNCDIETLPNLNLNGDIGLLMQLCSFTDHQQVMKWKTSCRLNSAEQTPICLLISFNHACEGAVQRGWPAVKWDLVC